MRMYWIPLAVFHMAVFIHSGKSCMVDVNPKLVFSVFNKTVTLNCTSSCSSNPQWESRLLKKFPERIGNFSLVEVDVDDWEDSFIECIDSDVDNEIYLSNATVIAYALPSRVDIDLEKTMEEGKEYEVTCQVYDVAPVKLVTVSLTRGGELFLSQTYKESKEKGPQNLTKTFTIKADRRHLEFGCQVTMNLIDVVNTTVQSSPAKVSVNYPPKFTSCLEPIFFIEGRLSKFDCAAEGSPTPSVQCTFNSRTFQPPENFDAARNMSGVYECEALSSLKNVTILVNVTVQYPPNTPVVTASVNSTIRKGAPFNLSCQSDALPHPTYHWKIPPRAKVIYSSDNSTVFIENASSDYNGTYTCEVTNDHGQAKTEQHVEIEKDDISWIIILAVGVAVVVIIIGLITFCVLKKGKKGFYDLLKWNRGNPHTALPLEEKSAA